jgi:hypothetical protein
VKGLEWAVLDADPCQGHIDAHTREKPT